MNKHKSKKNVTSSDVRKILRQRSRQLVFDEYPEAVKEFLTRMGLNPYEEDVDDMIERCILM